MSQNRRRLAALMFFGILIAAALAGCGSRGGDAQAPPGMKVGQPLTAAQIEAADAKRQARGRQTQPGP